MKISTPAQILTLATERKVSVLSVDLFDTLIFRTCSAPDRVFRAHFSSIKNLVTSVDTAEAWVELRKSSEREVAEARFPEELRLDEIYDHIAGKLSLSPDVKARIQQLELDTELEFIRPYSDVIAALKRLRDGGVTIVVNTDTYLPASFIQSVITSFMGFDVQVLCSSETRRPKRSGMAFDLLKQTFPGATLLHIGDNPNSDVRIARQKGVAACLVQWTRDTWLRKNRSLIRYLEGMGVYSFPTPMDQCHANAVIAARDELAWRWAAVLCDFLACLRDYAEHVAADEIWFLSRDGEVMQQVMQDNGHFLRVRSRYVFTSRAATYPVFAAVDPQRFERAVGRVPGEEDEQKGRNLIDAYSQQVNGDTRRIVIVDAGWTGRLQAALHAALHGQDVRGFYFSLDDLAEPDIRERACCFLPWNPATISQPAVESLFGFEGRSCIGYIRDEAGQWNPEFRNGANDGAPSEYCDSLRKYLSAFTANDIYIDGADHLRRRASTVRSICIYPDQVTAAALDGWLIGDSVDGGGFVSLLRGGGAGRLVRLLGIARDGNLWPAIACWSLVSTSLVTRALQALMVVRKSSAFRLRRLLGSLPKTRSHPKLALSSGVSKEARS